MFNPQMETMPQKELRELQLKRLKKTVRHSYSNIPFYKNRMDETGVAPSDIKSLDDIKKIPFTTKDDLREHAPFGFLAVPLEKCIELHSSSGTTGVPVTVCYTPGDIEVWSEVMARCMSMAGLTKKDIFQNPIPYGTFTGAFGFHYGAQKVGAMVIPTGKGQSERQIELMRYYGTTFMSGVASYAVHLGQTAIKMGIEPSSLNVRNGIFGAEMFTAGMKGKIREMWNMDVHDIYGLTEMCGPGVSADCDGHDGLHLWQDHFLAEIIDPKTGEQLEPEEKGEMVLTTLTKEGMPLLRYRTRDISFIYDSTECECRRTHIRHAPIMGRSDDMLIIKGTNIFPGQIEEAIMKHKMVAGNWLMVIENVDGVDQLTIKVETKKRIGAEEGEELRKNLIKSVQVMTSFTPKIEILPPDSLPRGGIKAKRVIDMRGQQ
ncbi:MAG: phenylacetate--CoA ligase [Candidatus Thermoplasmatota archaeon]|nr:phenylacetate--CoA ligase [Candidatus Thermoplasmatota archaeon]